MTGTYDRINNLIHKAIDWDWETMTGNPALEIAAEIDAKDRRIAELETWTPISTEPDEIDVPYLVATLDGRVAERVWCRDWMGNAPEFYLRDEDSIDRGEIAFWRKIVPPVPTPMEAK